jgi:hypothetical protein
MSDVVEIYSAHGDQAIRDGALDYSHTITTKGQAEANAQVRCVRDRTIRKVAYYIVRDDGSFKSLFGYDNPDPINLTGSRLPGRKPDPLPRMAGKPPTPKGRKKPKLMDRLMEALKD